MKLVMKFGGTSIASGRHIRNICSLIAGTLAQKNKVIVVVSALGNVTDDLVKACSSSEKGNKKLVSKHIKNISKTHFLAAKTTIKNKAIQNKVSRQIETTISELDNVLKGVISLHELTPRVRDYVLSFGERLSIILISGALNSLGINSEHFTGKDAGIVTDSNFGEARPLTKVTLYQVRNKLAPLVEKGVTPVVAGFIATNQNGVTTTLGRGGSDYTASLVGSALGVDEIWLWTDVNGLMTADPRIEPSAKTISELSYQEAIEMAYFGAKMMHPRALEAAMEKGIPVRVRNTFNLDNRGTLVLKKQKAEPNTIVKAVSLIQKIALITVSGASMVGAPGAAAKLFEILGKNNVNVLMISQGSSEANISFAIPREMSDRVLNALEMNLLGGGLVREIISEDDVCIVALVGAGMKGIPGVASRAFDAVARKKVNIRMIAQGSSELNISFIVKEAEGDEAVKALHKEFRLQKT
ncbi:MAG: aspartate kinase [Candidatus Bathyarchaeota archaeon]